MADTTIVRLRDVDLDALERELDDLVEDLIAQTLSPNLAAFILTTVPQLIASHRALLRTVRTARTAAWLLSEHDRTCNARAHASVEKMRAICRCSVKPALAGLDTEVDAYR